MKKIILILLILLVLNFWYFIVAIPSFNLIEFFIIALLSPIVLFSMLLACYLQKEQNNSVKILKCIIGSFLYTVIFGVIISRFTDYLYALVEDFGEHAQGNEVSITIETGPAAYIPVFVIVFVLTNLISLFLNYLHEGKNKDVHS